MTARAVSLKNLLACNLLSLAVVLAGCCGLLIVPGRGRILLERSSAQPSQQQNEQQ